jgi:hypothetical protein
MVAPRCNAAYFSLSRKQCTFVGRARCLGIMVCRMTSFSRSVIALQLWRPAWLKAPPPLQALMTSLTTGCGIHPLHP